MCRTGRKGTKTLIWDNAETLLVQTIMDNDLAYYLERQMAATSEALDAKVALTSVRVAKQMDYRGMDSFGGAPTRTMLHRYKFSKRVRLFPKVPSLLLSLTAGNLCMSLCIHLANIMSLTHWCTQHGASVT